MEPSPREFHLAQEVFDQLKSALSDRYAIERELGRGGNAVVYLAHDLKHDRRVALKALNPELALTVRTERFLREIQISAKLNHPNILGLHDSGEAAGIPYYVMPVVEGESLRERLKREKQLPLGDALRITQQVAEVLEYAHKQGVVHRDIKPENILLHEGHAVVMDFGIARALTVASGEGVTEGGIAVGTPAYMSPEQASGTEVDGRSDLYSLGCVFYEMLTGHPPFTGATAQEILARHTLDPVPAIRASRPDISLSLERAVVKALAKAPVARFESAAEFARELMAAAREEAPGNAVLASRRRRLVQLGVGIAVLLAGGLLLSRGVVWGGPPLNSVAVLPFENLSTSAENEYFTEGMAEDLINALLKVPDLQVPARTSSFAFAGKNAAIREIARALGVAWVVTGSVRRAGNRIRVAVQLVEARHEKNAWSDTYDRPLEDVFAVQEEIARAISGALQVRLASGAGAPPLVPRYTGNVQAYDLYLKGRIYWNRRNADDMRLAIGYFKEAIARDSLYALAYSGLADAYCMSADFSYLPAKEAYQLAWSAAVKAVALDSNLAEAHVSLARVMHMRLPRDFPGAETEFRRAFALNGKYAMGHSWYGLMLATQWQQRYDLAISEGKRALELDPLSPGLTNTVGVILSGASRSEEAVEYLRKAIALEPGWATPYANLGRVYLRLRRYDEGAQSLEKANQLVPSNPITHRLLGNTYTMQGRFPEALAEYRTAVRLEPGPGPVEGVDLPRIGYVYAKTGPVDSVAAILSRLEKRTQGGQGWQALAIVYVGLGQKDQAIAALEHVEGAGFPAPEEAIWDPIRTDPRFVALLKKRGLEP